MSGYPTNRALYTDTSQRDFIYAQELVPGRIGTVS
jgi:hypothetical protein